MSQGKVVRRRLKIAEAVERATVVEQPVVCRGPLYIVHPTITSACAGSLQRIAVLLQDEHHPIAAPVLDALQAFIRDGESPFFGRDVAAARREIALLQHLVETGQSTSPATRTSERSPHDSSPLRTTDADRARSHHRSGARMEGGLTSLAPPGVLAGGVRQFQIAAVRDDAMHGWRVVPAQAPADGAQFLGS